QFQTANLSNIANENYFYDSEPLDAASGEPQYVEGRLSKTEGIIAPVFKGLVDSLQNGTFQGLTQEQKDILCWHMVIQILRSKEQREVIGQLKTLLRLQLTKKN